MRIELHQDGPREMERLWDLGQRHLVAGRYVSARQDLEAAEGLAWRGRDARSLARLYLSLLETRRQIRQHATGGRIVISNRLNHRQEHQQFRAFESLAAGAFLFASPRAVHTAGSVQYASRRRHACLEGLILLTHRGDTRLASLADPTFAGGLPVRFTTEPSDLIQPAPEGAVTVPLPPPGVYETGHPLHALAQESLLVAWEALALRWQARHRVGADAWEEMAWQRLAMRIDPACEPAAMRFIALAEIVQRHI
jgi:hypothetical protein